MTGNVFIIEGNELLVRMYRAIFQAMDCSVTHARTMAEALRLLRGKKPDLIILDDRLADGSGIDATSVLRRQPEAENTPIIATVARAFHRDDEAVRAARYACILTKPLQVDAFCAQARRHVGMGTAAPALR